MEWMQSGMSFCHRRTVRNFWTKFILVHFYEVVTERNSEMLSWYPWQEKTNQIPEQTRHGPRKGEKRIVSQECKQTDLRSASFLRKVVLARFPDNQTHFVIVTFPPLFRASKCSPGVRYHQKNPAVFRADLRISPPRSIQPWTHSHSIFPHSVSRTRKDFTRFLGW